MELAEPTKRRSTGSTRYLKRREKRFIRSWQNRDHITLTCLFRATACKVLGSDTKSADFTRVNNGTEVAAQWARCEIERNNSGAMISVWPCWLLLRPGCLFFT